MTLILSAFYKNGICICADCRYRTEENGEIKYEDNHDKVYIFANERILIFNHGVNKFYGKYWDVYCKEYEEPEQWKGKNINDIAKDFRDYIDSYIDKDLKGESTFFDICGKTEYDNCFKMIELSWGNKDDNWTEGIICSGDGKHYVENYLASDPKYNNNRYWNKLDKYSCKKELRKIFEMAVKVQKNAQGNFFSEKCKLYHLSCDK